MTKLDELTAACDATYTVVADAWADYEAACDAYYDELTKIQEENSDD
jgi:hypothetical protein